MLVIPVLDLLGNRVVRGVGGRRHEYRPVESILTPSARPLEVARAFRDRLNLTTLYVADLDGIQHQRPHDDVYRQLANDHFDLWIDAGVRSLDDAHRILNTGAAKVIVGLETIPGVGLLIELVKEFGASHIVFSLDLRSERPILGQSNWPDTSPLGLTRSVLHAGITQLIVLDLASVGEQRGPSTLALCRSIREIAPEIRLITGGGVRDATDLSPLHAARIDGVLLATALHQGAIGSAELQSLTFANDQSERSAW
jgi:phosphoribosylformimino-5-aminoimidazole carboxamide ribotide isomerase